MSTKDRSCEDGIRDWLGRVGYPLEMKVAKKMAEVGFEHLWQAGVYTDPDTGKLRDIDVIGSTPADVAGVRTRVEFHIECKVSRNPWVLFCGPSTVAGRQLKPSPFEILFLRPATEMAHRVLIELGKDKAAEKMAPLIHLGSIGCGLKESHKDKDGDDLAYKSVSTLMQSGVAEIGRCDQMKSPPQCVIIVQTIVIDGRLFTCEVDATGEPMLQECRFGHLRWLDPRCRRGLVLIDVVTWGAFGEYAEMALATGKTVLQRFEQLVAKVHGQMHTEAQAKRMLRDIGKITQRVRR